MRNLEWFEGEPEELEPGMVVIQEYGGLYLVGDEHPKFPLSVKRWAWVIKPHELEWLENMAGKNVKGRPEQ